MSVDGAAQGIDAKAALGVVVGGDEQPASRSIVDMAIEVMGTTEDPNTYEGTANYCAFLIVSWLKEDPTRAGSPTENVYRYGPNNEWTGEIIDHGWYERMKDDGIELGKLDLTGFMWGWAVNAARAILDLPEVPNPAILTIGVKA